MYPVLVYPVLRSLEERKRREDGEEGSRMKGEGKEGRGGRERKMWRYGGDRGRKLGRDGKCLGAVLVLLKGFLRI